MSDLIKRLNDFDLTRQFTGGQHPLITEAADRIKQLEAQLLGVGSIHMEAKIEHLEAVLDAEGRNRTRILDEQDQRIEQLEAFHSAVLGWREHDQPEWFCRRTAESVADLGRAALGVEDE